MNRYTLYLGDCLEVLPILEDKSVDFTITSPPFKTYHRDYDKTEEYWSWFSAFLEEINRVTKQYSLIFNSSTRLIEVCRRHDPHRIMIWYKGVMKYAYRYEPIFIFDHGANFKLNKRIWSDTFKFQPIHKWKVPYENPVGLYEALIKMVSNEGDTILDPCMGSGTTMEAAQNLRRSCIGIEIEQDYCDIIQKRCFGRTFLGHEVEYSFQSSLSSVRNGSS